MSVRVAVITGSRAEYGLLQPLLARLHSDARFQLLLVVTGAHLAESHGMTVREIEADAMPIAARVPLPLEDDSHLGAARALGAAVTGIGEALTELAPDVVVVLGDRYETFAAAAAATALRIPIAHIHGGELTLGSADDAFRHAITKMAVLHFTAAEEYRHRVIQMGEEPYRVFNVGALAVDNIVGMAPLPPEEFERRFGVSCGSDCLLVTFHPASAGSDSVAQLTALLDALDSLPQYRVLFTGSNADAEGRELTHIVREYAEAHPDRASFVMSLGREGYLSAVSTCAAVVGNSSSGVIEVPALRVPSVDIGNRQDGRIRPGSVIHVQPIAEDIAEGIVRAASSEFRAQVGQVPNPYGDGHAAERIADVLAGADFSRLGAKRFFDLDFKEPADGS